MNFLILPILGALLWRIRGGLINGITGKANWLGVFNDTTVRAIWAIGMTWAFWLTHPGHPWLGEPLAAAHGMLWVGCGLTSLAFFAGTTIVGWFGAALYPATLRDVALLSLSGVLRMAFVAAILVSPWPLVAGMLFGPAYWVVADLPHPKPWMFWGEFLAGAVIGLSLVLT